MFQICPNIERCINEKHLPYDFIKKIEREIKKQKMRGSSIKINLNQLYEYEDLAHNTYLHYRNLCMNRTRIIGIIGYDINNDKILMEKVNKEYLYQKQQVKMKKQKNIKIDYNTVFYS
mgnify:CR=1 FL=1